MGTAGNSSQETEMKQLTGKWQYESFCARAGSATAQPQIAAPWVTRGSLTAETDDSGNVTGKISFGPGIDLAVNGCITEASGDLPDGVDLTGEGLSAIYRLRGYFVQGSMRTGLGAPIIVGTVMSVQNDLAKQPPGASGPFVLWACG
jgi:hypothetical protein